MLIWALFITCVLCIVIFEIFFFAKAKEQKSTANYMTLIWFCFAVAFCFVIYIIRGFDDSVLFITAYSIELALSLDNIFIFILIFKQFAIKGQSQHRVLFIGVLSAIIMRFLILMFGIELIQSFQWVFYIFGLFLLYSGIKAFIDYQKSRSTEINVDSKQSNTIFSRLNKWFSIQDNDRRFIIKKDGKFFFTKLSAALFCIEQADLIFALDSIPAVLSVTND
ncbi:MAG: TerC family protein, partial [Proteobacteria bacterium]|nr:TerC family protein [Pseudomonadota bacterium]